MIDPYTGLVIPKTLAGNLAWRKNLLGQAATSGAMRRTLKSAASSSPIFWLNAFGWTFLQKRVAADGHETSVQGAATHVPFITWKIQDEAMQEIVKSIDTGRDALIRKSRDMGASWLVLAVFHWFWQFRPATTFLELSRKQSLVDKRGDMDSLFEKHRYLLRWQPEWLRPQRVKDNLLHLENLDIGTSLEGESTNENAGQASRKTAILLDEFARVERGEAIDLATADTTSCRIFNSTPQGPTTHFTRIYRALSAGNRAGNIITLPWWRHPDKGKDAHVVVVDGKEKWTSPWYEDQVQRRSKRNIAQNLDMEHGRSGDMFFDADEIEKHKKQYEADPLAIGNIVFDEDMTEEKKVHVIRKSTHESMAFIEASSSKPWRFWIPLVDKRPFQNTRYVFAVDISNGSGASNSVVTVLDNSTNMIIAKWWDAFTSPEALAEVVAFSAIWFGGRNNPLVIFEKNGPGTIFGKKLMKLGYPNVYYQKIQDQKSEIETKRWGWHSSPSRKEMLLGAYREALKTNAIINPCREALDEALDYVYDDNGRIEPGTTGHEEGGGQALHGDHVIADALCVLARESLPKSEPVDEQKLQPGTFAYRRRQFSRGLKDKDAWAQ